ncbi:hypothetical protein GmHk_01G001052 [Glycine max]|nr:hypothetical protein GmHk_01G001052 [Glycine max]
MNSTSFQGLEKPENFGKLLAQRRRSSKRFKACKGLTMATPPASPLPPPFLPAVASAGHTKRHGYDPWQLDHVDPATGKADDPQKKKLRTYLGIVTRDKVDVTYETWKEVLAAQKDLIWEDIQEEFEIPEAFDRRTKKKVL